MQTQAEGVQGSPSGIGRLFDVLRQTAQRAADAAVGAVRAQATEVLDTYRAELRRAVSVYVLCRAVLLFVWSATLCVVVALLSVWWESHRLAASLWAAAAFLMLAAGSAIVVWRLTRRTGNRSQAVPRF
jgi:uncharacterized membrane protein YqjE